MSSIKTRSFPPRTLKENFIVAFSNIFQEIPPKRVWHTDSTSQREKAKGLWLICLRWTISRQLNRCDLVQRRFATSPMFPSLRVPISHLRLVNHDRPMIPLVDCGGASPQKFEITFHMGTPTNQQRFSSLGQSRPAHLSGFSQPKRSTSCFRVL